ncbi:MAG TPA: ABC transporter permease [Thermoanaerobaculia bacterium]|jgi:hypothetical protein|nr:ABC transporter permease [Thermoanaerobaculia bacterium]
MRWRDHSQHVRQSLRAWVFFTANVVAIGLGAFLLSVLLALSTGIERAVDRLTTSQASPLLIEVRTATDGTGGALSPRALGTLRSLPGVRRVDPVVMPIFAELYRDAHRHVFVSVMSVADAGDPELARLRWLATAPRAPSGGAGSLVLPLDVAQAVGFGDSRKVPGQSVTLRFGRTRGGGEETLDLPFVIAGVVTETRLSRCLVPVGTMTRLAAWHAPGAGPWTGKGGAGIVDAAFVYVRRLADVEPVRRALEGRGFQTKSVLDSVKDYGQILLAVRVVLGLIAGIAFLAGSASIFSATYASVLRRYREFAVFKAYGASRRDLYAIVLVENVFTAAVAAVVGFAAAAVVCFALNRLATERLGGDLVPIEARTFLVALAVAVVTCILASVVPAKRAAQSSVVDALASTRER